MKQKPDKQIVAKLRAVIDAQEGRVPRGISWPPYIDDAVNEYISAVNADAGSAPKLDRSGLIQIAITQFLELKPPKEIPAASEVRFASLSKAGAPA
jgi:hypothetical protein